MLSEGARGDAMPCRAIILFPGVHDVNRARPTHVMLTRVRLDDSRRPTCNHRYTAVPYDPHGVEHRPRHQGTSAAQTTHIASSTEKNSGKWWKHLSPAARTVAQAAMCVAAPLSSRNVIQSQ